jgi:predicted lipoprotein with Yx(FWY)xxD motif
LRRILAILVVAVLVACATQSGDKSPKPPPDKPAPAPPPPPPVAISGGVLVNAQGMTLYTFDRDVAGSGRSNCNGDCAFMWPPLEAVKGAKPEGALTIIGREGGGGQWCYKGKPLYLFSGDGGPGDNTGDGVNGVWHVATP